MEHSKASNRGLVAIAVLIFLIPSQAGPLLTRSCPTVVSFDTVQQAINEAEEGSTILVPSGTYFEHVIVNKTVSLIGENPSATIIDGGGTGTVIEVAADGVQIAGFTIQNSGWGWTRNGILVQNASRCEIRFNRLVHNCHNIRMNFSRDSLVVGNAINGDGYGIRLLHAVNCAAAGNNVTGCIGGIHLEFAENCTVERNFLARNNQGIRLYSPCSFNVISANTVTNNTYDGMIDNSMNRNSTFFENRIYHNNFINNTYPFICKGSGNVWQDGYPSGGNFWDRYNGSDLLSGLNQDETGSDGIGDVPYAIDADNIDQYPLIRHWDCFPVRNVDTGMGYASIRLAVNANETLDGHTLRIESALFYENVKVNKSLNLKGQGASKTIIDGNGSGTVLQVTASNVNISDLTVRHSGSLSPPYGFDCGVLLNHTLAFKMNRCSITENTRGLYILYSNFSSIEETALTSNEQGMSLWYSGGNVLNRNTMADNKYDFGVFGSELSHFANLIDTSNTVHGSPIIYFVGARDLVINETTAGTLYFIDCINVTVRNLALKNNGQGVFCFNVTDSRIENVSSTDSSYGIYLQKSTNNCITVSNCRNDWVGLYLQESNLNLIENNKAAECEKALSLYEAYNNTIRNNDIVYSIYGIRLFSSSFNSVFHNNFLGNTQDVDQPISHRNLWDNGFEGNYWSGYLGSDFDGDGVGDTNLPAETVDNYPLMSPYLAGDINHDGKTSILDVVEISISFLTVPSDESWNPHADVAAPYGKIDFEDLNVVMANYGARAALQTM